MSRGGTASATDLAVRNAVAVVFVANGLAVASLLARVPDLRSALALSNASLGVLLLAVAAGSLLSLPTSGRVIEALGAATVVRVGAALVALGLLAAATAIDLVPVVALAAAGLFVTGIGIGMWDVAMNSEAAEVERRLARTIMPRFHAGFSLGAVLGAGMGATGLALGLPVLAHLALVAVLGVLACWRCTATFAPVALSPGDVSAAGGAARPDGAPRVSAWSAWTEPRTLAVGLMVLCFAVAEGSANDWLSLALIDGHAAPPALGVAGFTTFVAAMTLGRLLGPGVLDRHGRAPVLAASAVLAALGVLLVVLGDHPAVIVLGIVCWGLGAALGFPVGMSVAADDPARAAARLSVVATIGYAAFLAGPPLLGYLGDEVGTLPALLAVAALMGPAVASALAARPVAAPRPDAVATGVPDRV